MPAFAKIIKSSFPRKNLLTSYGNVRFGENDAYYVFIVYVCLYAFISRYYKLESHCINQFDQTKNLDL